MFVFLPGNKTDGTCQKAEVIRLLEEKVGSPEERSATLHESKEGEEFTDRSLDVLHREEEISGRDQGVPGGPKKATQSATAPPQGCRARCHSVP